MKRLFVVLMMLVLVGIGHDAAAMDAYVMPKPGIYKSEIIISDSITIHKKKIVPKRRDSWIRATYRLQVKGQPMSKAYADIRCFGLTSVYSTLDNYTKYGILGRNGKPVTAPLYSHMEAVNLRVDGLDYLSGRYLLTKKNDKGGVIDSLGNVIVDFEYDYISAVNDSTLKACNSMGSYYFNLRGEPVNYSETPPLREPMLRTLSGARYEYEKVFELGGYIRIFDRDWMSEMFNFENQNYSLREDSMGRQSLYDHCGHRITESAYDYISPFFGEWILAYRLRERGECGGLRRVSAEIIDCHGRKILTPTADLDQALCRLKELASPQGKVPRKTRDYDTILLLENLQQNSINPIHGVIIPSSDLMNNRRVIGLRDGRWKLLDRDLRPLGARTYDEIDAFFRKRAMVRVGDKWGLIDSVGNEVLPPIYDAVVRCCGQNNEFRTQVKRDGKWGVADYWGGIVAPTIYDEVLILNNMRFFLQKEGCTYLLDSKNVLSVVPGQIGSFTLNKPVGTTFVYTPKSQKNYKFND